MSLDKLKKQTLLEFLILTGNIDLKSRLLNNKFLRTSENEWIKLLESEPLNPKGSEPKDQDTAIHRAAREGNINIINILLELKVSLDNSRKKDRVTPLCIAAQNGHLDVVKLLLER